MRLLGEARSKDVRVLEIGGGSGRNSRALTQAGARVTTIEAFEKPPAGTLFEAILSTHALLHGTPGTLGAMLGEIGGCLEPEGRLYASFGSKRDARFGTGTRISEHVFAATAGDEAGVAHTYWNQAELRDLLAAFEIVDAVETNVDAIAGTWAHEEAPLAGAFHWIVVAGKR